MVATQLSPRLVHRGLHEEHASGGIMFESLSRRADFLKITGFELCVTQMTGIMVMTGNKQGCWCRNGWRDGWRGRWETWPPFLPTVRSLHRADIHREVIQSGQYLPLYCPPPLHSQLRRLRKLSPWQYDATDSGILAWGKVSGTHWGLYESRCAPLCATPLYPPPHPPQPLNLLPVPQLAYKADNELFIAAIHLHTSHCNCFSLWFSLWLCIPPANRQENLTKKPRALLSPQMNGCILGKYFSEMEQEQERGRISCCQLKSNNPTSCQWSSISVLKCTDVSPSVKGLAESRTA